MKDDNVTLSEVQNHFKVSYKQHSIKYNRNVRLCLIYNIFEKIFAEI